ncbi:hypothetical protein KAR48_18615 [bacterium]|nr:hypothetical protein [bacterium]
MQIKNGFIKQISLVGFMLILVLAAGCTFDEVAQPDWDVDIQVPLLSKRYTMIELSDEIDELVIDMANDEVILNLEKSFETFQIGDKLKVDGVVKNDIIIPVSGQLRDSVTISSEIVVIDTAAIRAGFVTLYLENPGSNTITIIFELFDIKSPSGETLRKVIDVPPGNLTYPFSLDGYIIIPPIVNGENVIRFTAEIAGSTAENPINIDIDIADISFAYLSGIVNALEINIDSTDFEINIPDGLDGFAIQRAELKLAVNLGLQFPISIDLTLEGSETRDGSVQTIHVEHVLDPSVEVDTIVVDDIAFFLNALPERVKISGQFVLGDGVTRARITDEHVIETEGFFKFPLIFSLPSVDTKMEVDTIEISEKTRDAFRDNIIEAHFHADILNGLPVGGEIMLYFSSTRSDSTIFDLDTSNPDPGDHYVFEIPFSAGTLDRDSDPALVSSALLSLIRLDLDASNLPLFYNHEQLFWALKLEGDHSGVMVKVRPTDFFQLDARVSAKVNTYVEENDNEGGAS